MKEFFKNFGAALFWCVLSLGSYDCVGDIYSDILMHRRSNTVDCSIGIHNEFNMGVFYNLLNHYNRNACQRKMEVNWER